MCGLVFLLLLVAICAWLISNSRKKLQGRYKRRQRPLDIETYSKSDVSSYAEEIYVPYSGPPEVSSTYERYPAVEPYRNLPAIIPYSPYLFDEDSGQYVKGEINPFKDPNFDRPYFSTLGIRSSYDRPGDWYRSMPVDMELSLPRAWIR
ncbi:uncharacterized protein LOC123539521 [Mercenaria mercenaria]|uniref:uncharacterized protein LOC123539521 n=1 Tax=Mercenaria mercenaria TaxID=6596 RepID=UPI00234F6B89|nr:uncharacterized protein LOC123539521 [Mercenaria mercenaria]